ncbi:MAG TPA: 2-oxoacid:ferredoxin oxidoreductase subunit beta [Candidatus Krumholzibacteria bacterium]|nr:2-oxoacid:ferredoxin oxidoreductase subunit beta [Candidatus Krumholzibacteria bacterium]HRX51610.1 2-oxoacid:ferredoxin oxidoreductase subunit beta [Candidatus Krumholzibacteria bacterium]
MNPVELKPKDLKSDQEVRWCPGCGDYSILNSAQAVLAELGIPREKMCMISGIGCSSRFPYYMNTYGFHSIHGRALAIATGTKTANPELSVWVATGDGDCMSIGGNHFIHTLRRNVDLKILMFNNRIYGLTKGQYSPTTPQGQVTKTSPYGAVDAPFNPIELALGAGATFVARTVDTQPKHMKEVLKAAAEHKGTAFVEIWQNCVIFNDGAFKDMTTKDVRDDALVDMVPGQPLVFGKEREKGLQMSCGEAKVVPAAEADVWACDADSPVKAFTMASLDSRADLPTALGVFRAVQKPIFDEQVNAQVAMVTAKKGKGTLKDLIYTSDAWQVG